MKNKFNILKETLIEWNKSSEENIGLIDSEHFELSLEEWRELFKSEDFSEFYTILFNYIYFLSENLLQNPNNNLYKTTLYNPAILGKFNNQSFALEYIERNFLINELLFLPLSLRNDRGFGKYTAAYYQFEADIKNCIINYIKKCDPFNQFFKNKKIETIYFDTFYKYFKNAGLGVTLRFKTISKEESKNNIEHLPIKFDSLNRIYININEKYTKCKDGMMQFMVSSKEAPYKWIDDYIIDFSVNACIKGFKESENFKNTKIQLVDWS